MCLDDKVSAVVFTLLLPDVSLHKFHTSQLTIL